MSNVLDELIQTNEFPIIFIGSGISKRFIEDSPSWVELLKECWEKAGMGNFYGELNKLKSDIIKKSPEKSKYEINHDINIKLATEIEEKFNNEFYEDKIKIEGFSSKEAYQLDISPFKKFLSNKFKLIKLKKEMENERILFQKMLRKSQIILTTNYDEFIENIYNKDNNYKVKKYIGQKGFFEDTENYSEIYKVHGCISEPKSIVITESDYNYFYENSVLISAKIISMMINSPIIFMGYSLTDVNIRNIIGDFTKSLDDKELMYFEKRLILIEYDENEDDIKEERVKDSDLGCSIRVIKTNNFHEVFDKISKINQGIAPAEVRKYKHVMKKLIIDRGKEGALNSVLISPEEIDKIEEKIQNSNIAIAIGDSKYIFQIPDNISYALDYISDNDEISNETRLRYANMQTGNARFPCNKFLTMHNINNSKLHNTEKEKLRNKVLTFSDFSKHYKSINKSSIIKDWNLSIEGLVNMGNKKAKIYETIAYHIKELNLGDVKNFLIEELNELREKGEIQLTTELRRLLLIYDIIKYKEGSP
ncbi:SIR2 family protein [Mammaliicoccus sciuri]|uniref:SIR2 family protein n=1 Tax=Mammaliicoccus sciuri TaxID=1296 RepID=UPI001951C5A1|nr:SIR2 family protein [Mammaliicoccus sciuri]